MSSLESNKNLAGIGSILLMFPVVSIVGIILLYVGIKGLSDYYKDETIYRDTLRGVIYAIIALVAIAVAVAPIHNRRHVQRLHVRSLRHRTRIGISVSVSCYCFHFLCPCSNAIKKSLQQPRTKNRRTHV